MTENKRIIVNVFATYARTLLKVACGLFTTRWVLMSLGEQDYGLCGVVGGLIAFASTICALFSGAIARFFAIAIGQSKIPGQEEKGLYECRAWFTCSVVVHLLMPLVLVSIAYPVGVLAIERHWLNIPLDRINACLWVWRIACVSSYLSMSSSPIMAMFQARQNIAEITLLTSLEVVLRTGFCFYMTLVHISWLVPYCAATAVIALTSRALCVIWAILKFPECRILPREIPSFSRYRRLVSFAGWQGLAAIGYLAKCQGMAIIVNRNLGAEANASMNIGNALASQSTVLSGALEGSFAPAIMTARGSNNLEKMRSLSYRVSKFSSLLLAVVAVPLAIEVDVVLKLWLKNPPRYSNGICLCMLVALIVGRMALGHRIAINAMGRIALTEFLRGAIMVVFLPFAVVSITCWKHLYAIGVMYAVFEGVAMLTDVYMARSRAGMFFLDWVKKILMPVIVVVLVSLCVGLVPSCFLAPSLLRVIVTTFVSVSMFCVAAWFVAMSADEKTYLSVVIKSRIAKWLPRTNNV